MNIDININFDFTLVASWSITMSVTIIFAVYHAIKEKQKK